MASKKRTKEAMTILAGEVHADRMITKRDGTFEMRFGFFYRHGGSAEKRAERVKNACKSVEIADCWENWRAWPKDSYWVVKVAVDDADALIEWAETICKKYKCEWAELVQENRDSWD